MADFHFPRIKNVDGGGVPAIRGDAKQGTRRGRSEYNVATGTPITTSRLTGGCDALHCIGYRLNGATAEVNPSPFATGKKSYLIAVSRPERKISIFGTRQQFTFTGINTPHRDHALASGSSD